MRKKLHLIIFAALLCPLAIQAQENDLGQVLKQAHLDYQIGRLDQTITELSRNLDSFQGSDKQRAYRLISICYLDQDKMAEAEEYASKLLNLNQTYSSVQDPIRFEELINRLKSGRSSTITTASSKAENIEEAPVPVTLITEEMIINSGARNLKELLISYVPGMNDIESNEEMNMAMRGIYSSGQEKILVMLNGHRLNSYCTNVARPDYSISLEKIKQIEVLRGPASSLYGGVALTAVVNIITKSGLDIDGLQLKGSVGNFGQIKGSAIFGKRFMDVDIMAWANIYKAEGEKHYLGYEDLRGTSMTPGDIILGGFNKKPSYDMGVVIDWKDFRFMHNSYSSKAVSPYNMSYFFSPYSYDNYMTFNGNAPGFGISSHHSEIQYHKQIGNLNITASVNYDTESQMRYQIATDTLPEGFPGDLALTGIDTFITVKNGVFQIHQWEEEDISGRLQLDYQYQFGDHQGLLMIGGEMHRFRLNDSYYSEGANYNEILVTYGKGENDKNMIPGKESASDAFVQLKHQWKNFTLNAGIRYDYKKRNQDETKYILIDDIIVEQKISAKIQEWSPRVALIYVRPKWSAKVSYSKSFVDAPYFYRNNNLDTSYGFNLESEYLHSWQFTLTGNRLVKGLNIELTGFYNKATNLVHRDGMFYYNSGSMKSNGLELIADYRQKHFSVMANLTSQYLIDAEDYRTSGNTIYNIPKLTANGIVTYKPIDNLRISATANYTSKQITTMELPDPNTWDPIYTEIDVPARVICGLNASYAFNSIIELGVKAHNIFAKKYEQGGTSIGPIRQQGFWMLGELTIKL